MRGQSYTLLNIFGPSDPNGHYSYSNLMSRINEIADYAMAEASIWFLTALGRNSSIKLNEHSFDGCLDAVYDKNGILAAYGSIIDVAPGVSSVEIGNGRYTYINTALLGDKIQRVIIDTYCFPENEENFAGTIADLVSEFSDKAEFVLNITNPLTNVSPSFFMALRNCSFEKLTTPRGKPAGVPMMAFYQHPYTARALGRSSLPEHLHFTSRQSRRTAVLSDAFHAVSSMGRA